MMNILKIISIFTINMSFIIILTTQPLYSILGLITIILNFSILLFSLEFEFISYILLIVYIGAVIILFLFFLMMINLNNYYIKNIQFINYMYFVIFFKLLFIFQYTLHTINNMFPSYVTFHSNL